MPQFLIHWNVRGYRVTLQNSSWREKSIKSLSIPKNLHIDEGEIKHLTMLTKGFWKPMSQRISTMNRKFYSFNFQKPRRIRELKKTKDLLWRMCKQYGKIAMEDSRRFPFPLRHGSTLPLRFVNLTQHWHVKK